MTAALTVMMPVYNARSYVRVAVESILSQTLSNFKLLIIDDGSDDGSGEILEELARRDARIELVRRGRKGQIESRNELLQRAQSDIVACADADDISHPMRLERQLLLMKRDPDLIVLGCHMQVMDEDGRMTTTLRKPVGGKAVRAGLLRGASIAQPACLMRRRAILQSGGYRQCYEHAEDYDMLLRAAERGKVDNADFFGVLYRTHSQSVSHRHAIRQMASADLARATHFLRLAGEVDPTWELAQAPAYDHPLMRAFVPSASLYAALEAVQKHPERAPLQELVFGAVNKRQSRHVQRAIIEAIGRRPFDVLSARALMRATALGPGRFVRLCYAKQREAYRRDPHHGRPMTAAGREVVG